MKKTVFVTPYDSLVQANISLQKELAELDEKNQALKEANDMLREELSILNRQINHYRKLADDVIVAKNRYKMLLDEFSELAFPF